MHCKNWRFILIVILFLSNAVSANSQVVKSVVLDSVVVEAVRRGFNVADFIEMVKADTSFLRAFNYLRNSFHEVEGNMIIYNKKNKITATRYRRAQQIIAGNKSWMFFKEEKVTGDFYNRKEKPELYTAEIFDEIFFYKDTVPVYSTSGTTSTTENSNNAGNINKLKKLVFNPGAEISGVPIIGKRMAIFDDDMVEYYDYNISIDTFGDSISCYVFSCKAKPGSGDYPVVKNFNTWFDRKTFNIVYRDYQLTYSGVLFDFDVEMKVEMKNHLNEIYPGTIEYSGFWDIPMKKQETVDFQLKFDM